jgi:hypothetical protein
MFSSIKYSRNKMYQSLKIVSIILFVHLFPACDSEESYPVEIYSSSVYLVNIESDSTKKIVDGENPVFVPNSNKIVYRYYYDLITLDLITNQKKNITIIPITPFIYKKIDISSNGNFLLFNYNGDRYPYMHDLYSVSLIDGEFKNITNTWNIDDNNITFFNNGEKVLYTNYFFNDKFTLDSAGTSIIDISDANPQYLLSKATPLGFTQNDKYLVFLDQYRGAFYETTVYIFDMFSKSMTDTIILRSDTFYGETSLTNDMKLYYSANECNVYRLDLLTKEKELLWSGGTSRSYKFSPDLKKVLVNHDNYLELINWETNESKIYTLEANYGDYLGDPSFSEDSKNFVISRYSHKEVYQ